MAEMLLYGILQVIYDFPEVLQDKENLTRLLLHLHLVS